MSTRRAAGLVLFLAAFSVPTEARDRAAANSLWVGEEKGVLKLASSSGDLLLEIPGVNTLRAVQVDMRRETLWVYGEKALLAYDFTGRALFTVPLHATASVHAAIAVSPGDGAVWVATNHDLVNVSADGQLLGSRGLDGNVVALDVDPELALLWVATDHGASALDLTSGSQVRVLPLGAPEKVADLRVDLESSMLWLALDKEVRRYSETGELLQTVREAGVERVAAAGGGAAWIATKKTLRRLDANGTVGPSIEPFAGAGTMGDLVVAGDRSVWVASANAIAHLGADGTLIQHLSFKPPIHIRGLAVNGDSLPPALSIRAPLAGACLPTRAPQVEVRFEDVGWGVDAATFAVYANGALVGSSCATSEQGATCRVLVTLPEGQTTLAVTVEDYSGNVSPSAQVLVTLDVTAPVITVASPTDGVVTEETSIFLTGALSEPAALTVNGQIVAVGPDLSFSAGPLALQEGENVFELEARDCSGNRSTRRLTVRQEPPDTDLPPDPATTATPVDPSVATDIATATAFLYSGSRPVQSGVAAGVIEPHRVAVIRGKVASRNGDPLPGVEVTVLGHPELGSTRTRADGVFDLAVNGGGILVVDFRKDGFLPVQRPIDTPWRDFVWVDDVVLIQPDAQATTITAASAAVQVARGSVSTDEDGSRRATVVFQPFTSAELVMADGSRQALTTLTVRATEYTVGPSGPRAMPGPLPSGVAYTYAVELSADEALAAEAKSVVFSQPVVTYVENFLNFPVGGLVPTGYYDRDLGAWMPSDNGRIVKILAIADAIADLDVDGSGAPADAASLEVLGVTDDERRLLATLYAVGQELWRVPISHFTPWDCNWPYGPPDDAERPKQKEPKADDTEDDHCPLAGSIIECQNQTLGESLPILGTGLTLNYRSDRVPGREATNTLDIPLSGATVPASLKRIELKVAVAGRLFVQSFPPGPNQVHRFTWDGKDAYGRYLSGRQPVRVDVGYVYDAIYYEPARFLRAWAGLSGLPFATNDRARLEITLWQRSDVHLLFSSWFVSVEDLGGWTLSNHHYYDETGRALALGNGEHVQARPANRVLTTAAGCVANICAPGAEGPATEVHIRPRGIAVTADGSVYIADQGARLVRRLRADGNLHTFAGGGTGVGSGLPATQARLFGPVDVAVAPDGSVYIADQVAVRKVDGAGILTTVYSGLFVVSGGQKPRDSGGWRARLLR